MKSVKFIHSSRETQLIPHSSWLISRYYYSNQSLRVDSQTHFQHMNHGPAFQALWSRLRAEVRRLQDRGYYGDGQEYGRFLVFINTIDSI